MHNSGRDRMRINEEHSPAAASVAAVTCQPSVISGIDVCGGGGGDDEIKWSDVRIRLTIAGISCPPS